MSLQKALCNGLDNWLGNGFFPHLESVSPKLAGSPTTSPYKGASLCAVHNFGCFGFQPPPPNQKQM